MLALATAHPIITRSVRLNGLQTRTMMVDAAQGGARMVLRVALRLGRPWRVKALSGEIYAGRHVPAS